MAAPKAVWIESLNNEGAELAARLRRRKVARGDTRRAEIVLLAAEGVSNLAIAEQLGITRVTVATWRRRFAKRLLNGLLDEPHADALRTVTDQKVANVVTATSEKVPVGRTHWSSRGMARASGLAPSTVQRIWRAFSLQPHRSETYRCPRIRRSSARCATSSGYISTRESGPWSCVWTKRRRCRRLTAHSLSCPCGRGRPNGEPMTTSRTGRTLQ